MSLQAGEATSIKSHKGFPHHDDHQYEYHHRHNCEFHFDRYDDQVMATTLIRMTTGAGGFFRYS